MTTTRMMFDQFSSGNDTRKSSGFLPRWSTTHSAKNTIATEVRAHATWTSGVLLLACLGAVVLQAKALSSTVEGAITAESSSDPQRGQGRAT